MRKTPQRLRTVEFVGVTNASIATFLPLIGRHIYQLVFCAAAAVSGFVANDARACSALPSSITSRFAGPAPMDADAWPLNGRIEVQYGGQAGFSHVRSDAVDGGAPVDALAPLAMPANLGLRTAAGVNVPVRYEYHADERGSGFTYTLIPRSLMPNTRYEVTDLIAAVPCGQSSLDACRWGEPVVIRTFTTAAAAEQQPPTKPGQPTVKFADDECDQGACCGPYAARVATISWSPSMDPDTGKPVGHVLTKDGKVIAARLGDSVRLNVCGRSPFAISEYTTDYSAKTGGTYRIRGVDRTGTPSTESASFEFAPAVCDGFGAAGSGCSYGGRRRNSAFAGVLLLLTAVRWGRRRMISA